MQEYFLWQKLGKEQDIGQDGDNIYILGGMCNTAEYL